MPFVLRTAPATSNVPRRRDNLLKWHTYPVYLGDVCVIAHRFDDHHKIGVGTEEASNINITLKSENCHFNYEKLSI